MFRGGSGRATWDYELPTLDGARQACVPRMDVIDSFQQSSWLVKLDVGDTNHVLRSM